MLAVGMGARRSEFLTPVLKRNNKDQGGKNSFTLPYLPNIYQV